MRRLAGCEEEPRAKVSSAGTTGTLNISPTFLERRSLDLLYF